MPSRDRQRARRDTGLALSLRTGREKSPCNEATIQPIRLAWTPIARSSRDPPHRRPRRPDGCGGRLGAAMTIADLLGCTPMREPLVFERRALALLEDVAVGIETDRLGERPKEHHRRSGVVAGTQGDPELLIFHRSAVGVRRPEDIPDLEESDGVVAVSLVVGDRPEQATHETGAEDGLVSHYRIHHLGVGPGRTVAASVRGSTIELVQASVTLLRSALREDAGVVA